jgi:hypothetical protein
VKKSPAEAGLILRRCTYLRPLLFGLVLCGRADC